jgi:hypothetical protein
MQSQALPAVVDQMQAMMAQMERMDRQMHERLLGNQESFHSSVKGVYTELAASVDQSLRSSLAQSAQIAGESLTPVVEATLRGIAGEARQMHERMVTSTQTQLDALSARAHASAASVAETWSTTYTRLQADQTSNDSQRLQAWRTSLESMAAGLHSEWQQTSARTLAQQQQICTTLTQTAQQMADSTQTSASKTLNEVTQLLAHSEELVHARMAAEADWSAQFEKRADALLLAVKDAYAGLQAEQSSNDKQRLLDWRTSLEAMAAGLHSEWQQTSARTLAQQQQICTTLTETAQQVAADAQSSAGKTLGEISQLLASSEELVRARIATESEWSAQHGARMAQITAVLQTELGTLRDQEAVRGHAAVERLGALQTAVTGHLTTLGTALEDPITRLIETASEAPRAAAEVIGQLRQEISHSVARDNALLEERSRIMETLNALLGTINHASTEQRAVIDALVASSALALQSAGSQFAEQVGTERDKLSGIAAHVSSSAVEVSTLSDTFSFAVRAFNEANEKLIANLQRIEGALDKSMARSDDQLAYYVAQAREIMDLSILSQKEMFAELRQAADQPALQTEEAA